MAVNFKVFLVTEEDPDKQEIRRFGIDQDVVTNFLYIREKLSTVFPSIRGKHFTISWKGKKKKNNYSHISIFFFLYCYVVISSRSHLFVLASCKLNPINFLPYRFFLLFVMQISKHYLHQIIQATTIFFISQFSFFQRQKKMTY